MSEWQPVANQAGNANHFDGHTQKPLQSLTVAVLILTGVVLVGQVVQLALYRTFNPVGFSGTGGGQFGSLGAVMAFLLVFVLLGLVGIAHSIVALVWMYRASANVTAAGIRDRTWGPGWAVGAWFIPVANIVLGFFVIREIWRGSQPGVTDADWKQVPLPPWMIIWWTFFATSYAISYASAAINMGRTLTATIRDPMADPVQPIAALALSAGACYIIAGIFFMRFARVIQELQDGPAYAPPALPKAHEWG